VGHSFGRVELVTVGLRVAGAFGIVGPIGAERSLLLLRGFVWVGWSGGPLEVGGSNSESSGGGSQLG
jgi:hypothetical protein